MPSTPPTLWSRASFTFIIIFANNTQCPELGWETSYSLDTLAIYPLVLFLLILQTAHHFLTRRSVLVTCDRCIHHWLPPPADPLCIPGLYLLTIRTLNRSVERLMRQFSGLTRCVKVTPPDPPGAPQPLVWSWPGLLVILNITGSPAFYIRTVHQASTL